MEAALSLHEFTSSGLTAPEPCTRPRPWDQQHLLLASHITQAQPTTSQAQPRRLFDRDSEKEALTRYMKQPPGKILCLLGPRNCGKSALMRWMVSREEEGPAKDVALLYNCRYLDTSSPQAFAQTALKVPLPRLFYSPDSMVARIRALLEGEKARRPMSAQQVFEVFLAT